jgi:hypothetical protein
MLKTIDLKSEQGNVFYLVSIAKDLSKKLNFNTNLVINELLSGGKKNAHNKFKQFFGEFVNIID